MIKLFVLISFIALCNLFVFAQHGGDLDTTFGNNGKVITSVGSSSATINSIAIQADGKLVVVGDAIYVSNNDFFVVRYNSDGTPDNSFGSNGIVSTAIGSTDISYAVTIQPDGKIIVAGQANIGSANDFAIVRYNTNGSLDYSFGMNGKVTTDFGTSNDIGKSIFLQSDGKILVAGTTTFNAPTQNFALAKYNIDGSLDNTFGTNGKVSTSINSSGDYGQAVIEQPDGKILLAGYTDNGTNVDIALLRYNTNGSLDTLFGASGKVITDYNNLWDAAYSISLQNDRKIILSGTTNGKFALVRYNEDGSLDNTFGSYGKVSTLVGQSGWGYSATIQPDNKIVLVGESYNGVDHDFALVRYNNDGSHDSIFGINGIVTTPIGTSQDEGRVVALQPDGKIVVAGKSWIGGNYNFAITRYWEGLTHVSNPISDTVCSNTNVQLLATSIGVNTIYYTWQYNDGTIWYDLSNNLNYLGVTDDTLHINNIPVTFNNYQYRCIVSDGINYDTTAISELSVYSLPIANAGSNKSICNGQSTQLSAIGGITYNWNANPSLSATNIHNPIANPAVTSEYFVTVTDTNGCTAIDSVTVNVQNVYQNEQICIVLVEHSTGKNLIAWEKTPNVGTSAFVVHKLSGLQYIALDTIPYDSLSVFVDYLSSPEVHADRYKLSVIDTCGNESGLSPYIQTISLGVSQGVPLSTMVLDWNFYEDESLSFIPAWYYIYKGTLPDNLILTDSISSAFHTYNDMNVFTLNYYAIGVKKLALCTPTSIYKDMSGPFSQSLSNIEDNGIFVNAKQIKSDDLNCKIYPNPANDKFTIELSKNGFAEIIDLQGRIIKSVNLRNIKTVINLQEIFGGVYTIKIKTDKEIIIKKLIKQ